MEFTALAGLGSMTFGEQVGEDDACAILDHALARGLNFVDTAEICSVPARRETHGATETIIGRWFVAWNVQLWKEVLAAVDAIRCKQRGPAQ